MLFVMTISFPSDYFRTRFRIIMRSFYVFRAKSLFIPSRMLQFHNIENEGTDLRKYFIALWIHWQNSFNFSFRFWSSGSLTVSRWSIWSRNIVVFRTGTKCFADNVIFLYFFFCLPLLNKSIYTPKILD